MTIETRMAEVLACHEPRIGGDECDCGWYWDRKEGRNHWQHLAAVLVKELGMKREYAVCIEDENDGKVLLVGSDRWLRPKIPAEQAHQMPESVGAFVGFAYVTDWSRDE